MLFEPFTIFITSFACCSSYKPQNYRYSTKMKLIYPKEPIYVHITPKHVSQKWTPLTKSSVEIRMIFVKFLNAHLQQPAMIINVIMQFHSVDKQYIPLPTDPRYAKPDLCRPVENEHDDVIKWKHFPHYWPFVRGIHRWPVKSPHKGQWHWAMIFSLICAWNKRLSKQS